MDVVMPVLQRRMSDSVGLGENENLELIQRQRDTYVEA